jgi:hypothetical protein
MFLGDGDVSFYCAVFGLVSAAFRFAYSQDDGFRAYSGRSLQPRVWRKFTARFVPYQSGNGCGV